MPEATWAWGACDGLFTPRPLAPVHDIAREIGGNLLEMVRGAGSRDEIFDAVLQCASAVDGMAVLVVEDAQWADEATLDLLRFLARRVAKLPVLLLVTFRDDALAPSDPLRLALGELAGQRYTRRIDLPPLSAVGVRRLAEGSSYSPDALYELTGGNPFFVVEVLSDDGTEIPASARDAVLARAARLSERARATLDLASLDAWRVDPDLVARAGDLGLETFDELVAVGLMRAEGSALRFRHELARRAIESEVPPHRKAAGHQALLQALIDTSCDDDARMAYHAEEVGDGRLVASFAPRAARHAAGLGAYRESAAQYERALRFPPDDPRDLAELYDGYADALGYVDSWDEATTAMERAIEIWRDLGDARREGHDHLKLCKIYWRLCRGAESVAEIRRAIEVLEPLGDDPELAYAYSIEAFNLWPQDAAAGMALLERAGEMAERVGDPTVRSDVLNNLAAGQFAQRGDWTRPMKEALRIALAAGAEGQAGRAYANIYTFYAAQFRFAEGERFWHDGIAYCDERDITTYSTCLRGHRSVVLNDLGRWDDALRAGRARPGHRGESGEPADLADDRRPDPGPARRRGRVRRARCGGRGFRRSRRDRVGRVDPARAGRGTLARGDDSGARSDLAVLRRRITPLEYTEDARLSVWEQRLLGEASPASAAPGPWATSLVGDHAAAAVHWDRLGCGYYAALSLYDSDCDEHLREAITRFEALGADAAARRTRQKMKDLGHRAVPTGARASTREHPLGLTRREDEVLLLLCEGLTNEEIAGRLVLSTRTVDHHVSAVLAKLGVSSRGAATAKARGLGLVPART